jgi:XTP/dITP diphosphohydrolase
LKNKSNRKAKFKTVICLILNKKEYYFEGEVRGTITKQRRGVQGFGYDPIFLPNGYQTTFAEMSLDIKNRISHRARAVKKLVDFLEKL